MGVLPFLSGVFRLVPRTVPQECALPSRKLPFGEATHAIMLPIAGESIGNYRVY